MKIKTTNDLLQMLRPGTGKFYVGWLEDAIAALEAECPDCRDTRLNEALKQAIPSLAAQLVAVPDGFALVPVELNPEMRQAFHDAHDDWQLSLKLASPDHEWSAMLAAAPKPEQQEALSINLSPHCISIKPTPGCEHKELCVHCVSEQHEVPELTDEEIVKIMKSYGYCVSDADMFSMSLACHRALIAADRAKRAKPYDDPAAAWRNEGFNNWRATRASRTTED